MTVLSDLQVFITHPHSCSYIEEQQATTLFVDPDAQIDVLAYEELTELGFRRSGNHIYRPHCESCKACIAARVPVDLFKRKRSQQKIWNRNQDLQVVEVQDIDTNSHYELYERYITQRHRDGDMYPPNREQYSSFLCEGIGRHRFYCFYKEQKLLAVAVTDTLGAALSAIYTFFDPDQQQRSLGVYGILWQIEQARTLHLKHLYLGYWIKDCQKMSYKTQYRPLELYINRQWLSLG
jgi:arginyl-tRNA--protein-N-Asp/Glu arginylyltransferase